MFSSPVIKLVGNVYGVRCNMSRCTIIASRKEHLQPHITTVSLRLLHHRVETINKDVCYKKRICITYVM